MTQLISHLRDRLLATLESLGIDRQAAEPALRLDSPKHRDHGDIALGAFQLAKMAKKAPPTLAQEIAGAIDADAVIESATAAGRFVNFRFQRAALAREVLPLATVGSRNPVPIENGLV